MKHPRRRKGYRRSWRFPEIVEQKIREFVVGRTLHVCSGWSSLGDVRIDLYERADICADMRFLPLVDESFESVVWDPPYTIPRLSFHNVMNEIIRVTKPLGRIITLFIKDPTTFYQRKLRLIWKAHYEPNTAASVRVLCVAEKLPFKRLKLGRREQLIPLPVELFEPMTVLQV